MEPSCGQSIVKCEKQKDDGRMETQKRKQNEKEKAERRMKIVAGLGSIDEYIPYVLAGADELFCGYVPYNWTKKYGTVLPLNRREVLAYNVHLGSFGELEILSAMIRKYRKPVHIAMNSLYYIPEQYEEIADIVKQCMKIGFDSFILADPALILYLRQKGISCKIHLSGEAGEMNREAIKVFREMGIGRIIFHRKNIGIPANKELSCCFQSRRNVDFVKIFVIILPFFFLVFFSCFVSNEDSEIIECQICIDFLF